MAFGSNAKGDVEWWCKKKVLVREPRSCPGGIFKHKRGRDSILVFPSPTGLWLHVDIFRCFFYKFWGIFELSFNSSWLLVGSWLFYLENFPCLVKWMHALLKWVWPSWTDIECSLFKPPHDLQHMHLKLTNMKGFVSKTTNSLPKVMMN